MKKRLYCLAATAFLLSCSKDKQGETFCFDGIVEWHGDPGADGLGWVIVADDSTGPFQPYVPRNLSDDYKVDDLKVAVCLYQTDDKFYCECLRPLDKYHVQSIKRR